MLPLCVYISGMEKFNNGELVIKSENEKSIIIIVTWPNGDNKDTFQGTVLRSDFDFYRVGEHSRTWHEDKFDLAPTDTEIKIFQKKTK